MFRTVVCAVLTGFTMLLLNCEQYQKQLLIKDTLGIGGSLSETLKPTFGLYVNKRSTFASTDDFFGHTLMIIGYTEGHMDWEIATLGMEKSQKYLFKQVLVIDTIIDLGSTEHDVRCLTERDTALSDIHIELPRTLVTYVNTTRLEKIFSQNTDSVNCVFVMRKSDVRPFSSKLKELIIK